MSNIHRHFLWHPIVVIIGYDNFFPGHITTLERGEGALLH